MKRANPKSQHRDIERRLAIRRNRLVLADLYPCRRNYFDSISPWHWKYVELLRLAELRHRYKLGDPRQPMIEATEDAERLATLWKNGNKLKNRESTNPKLHTESGWFWERLPLRIDVIEFRFATAAILSLIVCDEISPTILSVIPKMSDWTSMEDGFNYLNFPDAGLVGILRKGRRPRKWNDMLEFATQTFGRSLLQETFECYASIIVAARRDRWDEAVRSVERAHELYDERSSDLEYEEFEAWEGTGAGNTLSIDRRLSAIMRYCFRENPQLLDPLVSVHRWLT